MFVLMMPFAFFLLTDLLGIPYSVKYTVDAAWVLLLFYLLKGRAALPNRQAARLAAITVLFFAIGLLVYVFRFQSVFYFLWGLRNNARFFVFFFACVLFIKEQRAERYLRVFDTLFWLNFLVILYQYAVLGKARDHLGGLFGVEKGCNGYLNVFLLIVISGSILNYMNGNEKSSRCVLKCAGALAIAVLAELKIFVVELALISVLSAWMTRFSLRKVAVMLGGAASILVCSQLIGDMSPGFADWFSINGMYKIISSNTGYTGTNDMNRLTAIPIALSYLPSLGEKLFGLGLGNCDYSSFDFLVTPFFAAHERLHYVWFSTAFLVLETGLAGFALYCLFFVWVYLGAAARQKSGRADLHSCQLARVLAIMCFVLMMYDASLRTEAAYMMYFVLALPFISKEKDSRTGVVLAG